MCKTIEKVRIETKLLPSTIAALKAYAVKRYNGNKSLAIEESVELLIKRERRNK